MKAEKLTRMHLATDGAPIDLLVLDEKNFTAYTSGSSEWSAYVVKSDATNETFDFIPPRDGMYWIYMKNEGADAVKIHARLRSMK